MGRRRQPFRHLTPVPLERIAPAAETPALPPEALERLVAQLRRGGRSEPPLVAEQPDGAQGSPSYRVVVGERWLLAARELGWETLECLVLGPEFEGEIAAIRRLQQGDSDPFELADALERLRARCQWTQAQIGLAIGRTRDFVAGQMAITRITPEVRAYLAAAGNGDALTARHLRYIGRSAPVHQLPIARDILEQGLSTKTLERRLRRGGVRRQVIKVRTLRSARASHAPKTVKEWRKYHRQLTTDLRRVNQRETLEKKRTRDAIDRARARERTVLLEARAKRRALLRELRRAARWLERLRTS
jgi:ParB-like chromosome segregation protein Spo0J